MRAFLPLIPAVCLLLISSPALSEDSYPSDTPVGAEAPAPLDSKTLDSKTLDSKTLDSKTPELKASRLKASATEVNEATQKGGGILKSGKGANLSPALTWLQFRVSPSLYLQGGGGSLTSTIAWAPSFRLNPRFQLRAQIDITPASTVSGLKFLPGGSFGALYRFTPLLGAELDAGAQLWPGPQPLWPLVRALAVLSPARLGLGARLPLKFHFGYQPLFGPVFTHGVVAGAEISIL